MPITAQCADEDNAIVSAAARPRRLTALLGSLLAAVALALTLSLSPNDARADQAAWQALAQPGRIALMRHALAPGVGDPAGFRVEDCTTQRNLNEAGRQQGRAWRAALASRGISFTRVASSQWCRCLETARLVMGAEPEALPALNSFFEARDRAAAQLSELQRVIAALPADGLTLMVTHQVVITGLTGVSPASGEMVIVERTAAGALQVVARLMPPAG